MNSEPRRLSAYGNVKVRRRRPKRSGFVKGLIIYIAAAVFVIICIAVVGARYLAMRYDASPEKYMSTLCGESGTEEWRQLLRLYMPKSYPEYENAEELAYKVLSPVFNTGKVTYLETVGVKGALREYTMLSDGIPFAVLTLEDKSGSIIGLGEWEISSLKFFTGYFDTVGFPETVITVPDGAVLTVNGCEIDASAGVTGAAYPALSPGEESDIRNCTVYTFSDIYYDPQLSATLDGVQLELVQLQDDSEHRCFYFAYPDSAMHSITVTVPAGVRAFVGGTELTEDWASAEQTEGQLGDLDDGGTGTLPLLSVWTVNGLFGETSVKAVIGEKELALLSSEGGRYVFETPEECKYTVTVTAPAGTEVTVNGRKLTSADAVPGGAPISELGSGSTDLGRYDVSELGAVSDAVPAFDKYILTGYLALPKVTASLNGRELMPAAETVDGYTASWEYDCLTSADGDIPEERLKTVTDFASAYIKYICDGGAWDNPDNRSTLDANFESVIKLMLEGTSGYKSVMESYRDVNRMTHYDSFTVENGSVGRYIKYTGSCISCEYTCTVVRSLLQGSGTETQAVPAGTLGVKIGVLQVLYKGEWRIWGFTCSISEA